MSTAHWTVPLSKVFSEEWPMDICWPHNHGHLINS